jgi:hypothetical protein
MENMNITSARYVSDYGVNVSVDVVLDNGKEWSVPLDPNNRHYAEIMRQVEAGTLTIADAE